jgi:hypothetical protein
MQADMLACSHDGLKTCFHASQTLAGRLASMQACFPLRQHVSQFAGKNDGWLAGHMYDMLSCQHESKMARKLADKQASRLAGQSVGCLARRLASLPSGRLNGSILPRLCRGKMPVPFRLDFSDCDSDDSGLL